jgi:hypothetical protein
MEKSLYLFIKLWMVSAVALFLVAIPMVSYSGTYADCETKCLKLCSDKDDKGHPGCMTVCMDRCSRSNHSQSKGDNHKLCAEADTREMVRTNNPMLASNNDQPCYAGGKYVGNCSRNQPYYNVFSGACYATLQACKKADGDLSSVQGQGGCVRCGR